MSLKKIKIIIGIFFIEYKSAFYIFIPFILMVLCFNSLKYILLKKTKKKSKKTINNKINYNQLNSEMGKKHINFHEKSKKITSIFRISTINQEIEIACKKYKLPFSKFDFRNLIKIDTSNISNEEIKYSFNFWVLKLFFKIPRSACFIFYIFYGLTPKINFNLTKKNSDKIVIDYLSNLLIIKNIRTHNLSKQSLKKICKRFINKFDDIYSINLVKNYIANCGMNSDFLKEISSKLKKKNKTNKKNNNYLGSSLYAYGHMLSFIDYHYRLNNDNIKILLSPDWIANSCLAYYIKLKYKNCIIDNKKFLDAIMDNKFGEDSNNNYFAFKNTTHSIVYEEYKKNKTISPSLDKKVLDEVLKNAKKKKKKITKRYICLFNRDASFKKENFELNANDADRSCDINIFIPVIKFLIKKNFKVVIMSNPGQKKIAFKHSSLIDYANSKYKNDYNDISLVRDCKFLINGGASPNQFLPPLFRKFSLNLEHPFNRKPIFHDLAYYLLRPIYKNNKLLRFKDYFSNELFCCEDFEMMKKSGYKLGVSPPEMLLEATKHFYKAYKRQKNSFKQKKIVMGNIKNYYNIFNS